MLKKLSPVIHLELHPVQYEPTRLRLGPPLTKVHLVKGVTQESKKRKPPAKKNRVQEGGAQFCIRLGPPPMTALNTLKKFIREDFICTMSSVSVWASSDRSRFRPQVCCPLAIFISG